MAISAFSCDFFAFSCDFAFFVIFRNFRDFRAFCVYKFGVSVFGAIFLKMFVFFPACFVIFMPFS